MRKADPVKKAQQKLEIIKAALKCFSRLGLLGTTTDNICEEAGISPGRLYYYFKSKDAVIEAAIQYGLAETSSSISTMGEAERLTDAILDVTRVTEEARREIGISPGLRLEIIAQAERSKTLKPRVQGITADFRKDSIEALKRLTRIDPDLDPGEIEKLAVAIDIIWSGIAVMRVIDKDFDLALYRDALFAYADAQAGRSKPAK